MKSYDDHLMQKAREHEDLCNRCGACCGALGDACVHLKKSPQGRFFCEIYETRFEREHKTVSGETFRCVDIRSILHKQWKGKEDCAYYKRIKSL